MTAVAFAPYGTLKSVRKSVDFLLSYDELGFAETIVFSPKNKDLPEYDRMTKVKNLDFTWDDILKLTRSIRSKEKRKKRRRKGDCPNHFS